MDETLKTRLDAELHCFNGKNILVNSLTIELGLTTY